MNMNGSIRSLMMAGGRWEVNIILWSNDGEITNKYLPNKDFVRPMHLLRTDAK